MTETKDQYEAISKQLVVNGKLKQSSGHILVTQLLMAMIRHALECTCCLGL